MTVWESLFKDKPLPNSGIVFKDLRLVSARLRHKAGPYDFKAGPGDFKGRPHPFQPARSH